MTENKTRETKASVEKFISTKKDKKTRAIKSTQKADYRIGQTNEKKTSPTLQSE